MFKLLSALALLLALSTSPVSCAQSTSTPAAKPSLQLQLVPGRKAFVRGEKNVALKIQVLNKGAALQNVALEARGTGMKASTTLAALESGQAQTFEVPVPTMLRPGAYSFVVAAKSQNVEIAQSEYSYRIAARLPDRLPVMLWGFVDTPYITHDKLRANGFTRVFDLYALDEKTTFDNGKPLEGDPQNAALQNEWRKLDEALVRGLELGAIYDEPTHYLGKEEKYLRVGRDGKPNAANPNIMALHPDMIRYAENLGESAASWYGDHPAWTHALFFSEARDAADVSFTKIERDTYRQWSGGLEIPEGVKNKYLYDYKQIKDFPANRVIPDKFSVLEYYRWFWTKGDGWIGLVDAVGKGIDKARPDVTTWNDPSVRGPSIYGAGGSRDLIGHWTYTNPDPLRLAMTQDQLQRMAQGGRKTIGKPHEVFQMMQMIWYGSETATNETGGGRKNAFHDHDPDKVYITPSPHIFREAFWVMMTRPNDMIGYHGQQALWPSDGTHGYKHTHPQTQHEMRRMHSQVVTPLGPSLKKIGARKHDVAWLESFASQILAERTTWGWSTYELGSRYRALSHAGLQPDILYEESVVEEGLDNYKVLFLLGCDILPQSVYEKIAAWQKRGGFVIGDPNTCPAIKPNYVVKPYSETLLKNIWKRPDRAIEKPLVMQFAQELRDALKGKYSFFAYSDDIEIVPYARQSGDVDYLFAINDHRKAGDYVGQYGLVQEDGVAASGNVRVARPVKAAYDLVTGKAVAVKTQGGKSTLMLDFEPGGGRLVALTNQEIGALEIGAPATVRAGGTLALSIQLQDTAKKPMRGVWPMKIEILDPAEREAEWSGFYGAEGGAVKINFDVAPNDISGAWTIRATDWATRKTATKIFRVTGGLNLSAQEIEMEKKKHLAAVAALAVATALPPATAKADPSRNLSTPPKSATATAALPADAPAGAKLITENPSFESALQGWTTWRGDNQTGVIEASAEMARTGKGSALVSGVFRGSLYRVLPWEPGTYRMTARVRVPDGQAAKGKAGLHANISDERAVPSGFEKFVGDNPAVIPGGWRELTQDFELKNDFDGKAKTVTYSILFDGFEGDEKLFVDDFAVYKLK